MMFYNLKLKLLANLKVLEANDYLFLLVLNISSLSVFQGVGNNDQKVLVLAATNTPYALDQVL